MEIFYPVWSLKYNLFWWCIKSVGMIRSNFKESNRFVISPVYFGITRYYFTCAEEITIITVVGQSYKR